VGRGAPEPRAVVTRASSAPSAAPETAGRTTPRALGLPNPATSFIGRIAEVESLVRRLSRGRSRANSSPPRLITLTGPGGVGKTRLSLAAALILAEQGEPVTFVSLAAIRDAVARAVGPPVDPASAAASAYGLTARELKVFRLLADGQSDREIADALFISPRTASSHVATVLAKFGVDSRTAAVSRAHREGLA
jgi:DNA-binding CsgD family transcriptional regulator